MIINEVKQDVQVSGEFKTSGFKIQTNSKAFEILSSNIYTHKERAVIREISCNARDAHIAAGHNDPIKVHLPTKLEPWFTVRDFGIGLSDEDVRSIFTTYFCSTKTSSNDFVGALGLGSKSPFCLVDSFTVISYFDGKKNTYSCYKDENSEPQISLLTEDETTEHNGLEISMSIEESRFESFEEEAVNVYSYFEVTPNINKENVISRIGTEKDRYSFRGDGFAFDPDGRYGNTKAVMGGVAYDIPGSHDQFKTDGYIIFKMGEISFDAGRESLSLDDKTIAAIKARSEEIRNNATQNAFDIIEKQDTPFKKLLTSRSLCSLSFVDSSKIRNSYENPVCENIEVYDRSWRSTEYSLVERLPLPRNNNVEYYRHKPRFSTRIKQYIKSFSNKTVVLLTDEQIKKTKIDEDVLMDLDTLPKVVKHGKSSDRSTVRVFTYRNRGYRNSDKWIESDVENNNELKVYVEISRNKPVEDDGSFYSLDRNISRIESITGKNCEIYGIKTSFLKTKEFKDGNWISHKDYLHGLIKEKVSNTTFFSRPSNTDILDVLLKNLDDNFSQEINTIKSMYKNYKENLELQDLSRYHGVDIDIDDSFKNAVEELKNKYPMVFITDKWDIKDNIEIIKEYMKGIAK